MATVGGVILIVIGLIFLGGVISNLFRLPSYARVGRVPQWLSTALVPRLSAWALLGSACHSSEVGRLRHSRDALAAAQFYDAGSRAAVL